MKLEEWNELQVGDVIAMSSHWTITEIIEIDDPRYVRHSENVEVARNCLSDGFIAWNYECFTKVNKSNEPVKSISFNRIRFLEE